MQYKDLKEMNIKDWDGQPFYAIVADRVDDEFWDVDEERLNGVGKCNLIVGYLNGLWHTKGGVHWSHAYPIEWNEKPKPQRMTNRQLAMWLAKGKGQIMYLSHIDLSVDDTACVQISHSYGLNNESLECNDRIRVRKWDSEEWIEPTTDLLEDNL